MLPVETAFKLYTDLDGKPLHNGYVYFGQANQNPITAPVTVYWDAAGTQPAAQPLRTVNGYIMRAGTPANVFFDGAYSELVKDSKDRQVFYARTSNDFSIATVVKDFINSITISTGASVIGYIQAGIGAVVRTVLSKLRERVSVFDFMTEAQIADVRARTYTLDVTAALSAAYTYAASIRATAYHPAGGYKIIPATVFADEDGSYDTYAAFLMKSNLHVHAEPGVVFKVADNVSTDAAPKSMGIFCTNEVLANVSIRGIDFDMNGANNKISPLRPATYRRYNQSPILVSGTPGGIAARVDNMIIEYNTFRNNPGVCNIVAAQSNTAGVVLGKDWKINFNKFFDNGLDTDDHTSVFAWANDVHFIGNELDNNLKFHEVASTGGNTAYEIHGLRHRLIGNKVRNYFRGVWVSSNLTDVYASDSIIANNIFQTHFYGVDFFRSTATLGQPKNTLIADNTVEFDNWTFSGAPTQKSAFNIASEYAQTDILITGNQAVSLDTTLGATFVTITPQSVVGQTHSNITVRGNKARGFVTGANIRTNATNGLGYVAIVDNDWIEPLTTASFATAIGEFIDPVSPIQTLVLTNNRMIDERGVPKANYGTYIQAGTITDLYYSDCVAKGVTVASYYEAGVVAGKKHGTFEDLTFAPVFRAGGTAFTVGNGTVLGRYTLRGKEVMVNATLDIGTTTVIPAGSLSVDMPVASSLSGLQFMGAWRIFDTSTGNFSFGWSEIDGTASSASWQITGGTFATAAAPVVLAAGDRLSMQITYKKA